MIEVSRFDISSHIESDGFYYKEIYHVFTRDYNERKTKSYIFDADSLDLLDESEAIYHDNANYLERSEGMIYFGAKLKGSSDS